ncbi:DUF7195 family protein [Colwellia sp. 12G3]|uniref:DUF7195 family protein n=1 Tax=Colwellia sp. 12G3 TaxID=2058299 RepID=UPI0018E2CDCB|nr:hypothetical protein [Colwellia sp. 12G3]
MIYQQNTKILRIDSPVVVRKTPMSASGSNMLRAIRDYLQEKHSEKSNEEVEIPFPTAIHLMMEEFCQIKGIEQQSFDSSLDQGAKKQEQRVKELEQEKSEKKTKELEEVYVGIGDKIINNIIKLIIVENGICKIHLDLQKLHLKLSPIEKKKLKGFHVSAISNNFLNETSLINFLRSINYPKAIARFTDKRNKAKAKKKTKITKTQKVQRITNLPANSIDDILETSSGLKKIGLGLESNVKISRVRAYEVIIDKNTSLDSTYDKSILYAAGWSIKGADN